MPEEYNPMQDPKAAVERAKARRVGKPGAKATEVKGPTVVQRDSDVDKAAGVPVKRDLPLKQAPRKPGEKPGEGKLQKVTPKGGLTEEEMKAKAPGYFLKGRYMTKPPPKPPPKKKDLTAGTIGGLKQPTIGEKQRADVDVKTGKPKSTWQRVKAYATRHDRPGERAPRTQAERFGSIRRASQRTFPAEEGTKVGGILNIEGLRRQTTGPMGATQAPKTAPPARALSLEEKQRKGMRVTAADVPGTGKGPTPVGPTVKAGGAPGAAKVETLRKPGEGDLGAYKVKGYVPPKPKPRVYKKKKGYQPPARAETFREIWGGLFGKKK